MSKVLNTLSALGALVMAATPLIAVGGVAHAAESGARPAHILVADLNLGQASDAATFRQRVDAAAETFCASRGERGLNAVDTCRRAVREEAVERLGDQQRQDLRSAQASGPTAWTVAAR
jgi:UrcA family protein